MGLTKKTLLGKELIFTEEMDLFNSLRKKYLLLSRGTKQKAEEEYSVRINSYSAYRAYGKRIMDELFEHYLQIGVHDIISYDIYDIDEIVLREEFEKDFGCAYREEINRVVSQLNQIDAEQAIADEERKEMIQEASLVDGTLVSGTGNVVGDLFAMAGAKLSSTAINAVAKGGTALVTGGIRALEKHGAEKDRNTIFENPSTKDKLLDGMELDVFCLHWTIARLINERTGKAYFYYASEENLGRFEPVIRNILQGNFKDAEQADLERQQIHNVIMMNPYELRVYCYIMEENGGITPELRELLEYLFVDKASMADSYMGLKYNLSDYNTYESILEFEKVVLEEMEQFGVTECSYYDAVVARREALYIERRTFHDRTYDTIEERDFIEKQFNEFMDVKITEMTLDELLEKYDSSYDDALHVNNQEDARAIILQCIQMKMEEFKTSDEVIPYLAYAQQKKIEHKLENSELVTVFENRRKTLAVKEKISAGVAAVKLKLKTFVEMMKIRGKGLVEKLPFGKKSKKKAIRTAEPQADEVEETLEPQVRPELQATPEPQEEPEVQVVSEPQAALEMQVTSEPQATPATKECPQCGAKVKATGKFCTKCGYRF